LPSRSCAGDDQQARPDPPGREKPQPVSQFFDPAGGTVCCLLCIGRAPKCAPGLPGRLSAAGTAAAEIVEIAGLKKREKREKLEKHKYLKS
jgi:hypothetical protein